MTKRPPRPSPPAVAAAASDDDGGGGEGAAAASTGAGAGAASQRAAHADASTGTPAGGGSVSATPAPPGINEDDWFLPLDPPFKLPPRDPGTGGAAAKRRRTAGADTAAVRAPRHPPPPKRWLRLRQLLQGEGYEQLPASAPTFANMEAPPSTYPPKRYCDLTGLEAPYVDPKTGLRYAGAALFGYLRALPPDAVQARLAVRRAEIVLK
jgi:INO80 complex subunit C